MAAASTTACFPAISLLPRLQHAYTHQHLQPHVQIQYAVLSCLSIEYNFLDVDDFPLIHA